MDAHGRHVVVDLKTGKHKPTKDDIPEHPQLAAYQVALQAGAGQAMQDSVQSEDLHGTDRPERIELPEGTVLTQPGGALLVQLGDATAKPVIPVFINSVATPLGPLRRVRALGTAVGAYLATLGKRVLVVGSGGLSHDPPVPTLATAPPAALERIVHGAPMSAEQRQARQTAVIEAAREFASGQGGLAPLNPDWDRAFLDLLDTGRLAEVDVWDNGWIAAQAGNSAHEVRTWVAAFSALATQGDYQTDSRFYRAAPQLIAGFAIRTAVCR